MKRRTVFINLIAIFGMQINGIPLAAQGTAIAGNIACDFLRCHGITSDGSDNTV